MLYQLRIPDGNERSSDAIAAVLRSVHTGNRDRLSIQLIIATYQGQTGLFIECPLDLRSLLLVHLIDAYPGCQLQRIPDDALGIDTAGAESVALCPEYVFSHIKQHEGNHDPMTGILSVLPAMGSVVLTLVPASQKRIRRARRAALIADRICLNEALHDWLVQLADDNSRIRRWLAIAVARICMRRGASRIQSESPAKLTDLLFEGSLALSVGSAEQNTSHVSNSERISDLVGAYALFSTADNRLIQAKERNATGGLWSAEELAVLWHPPKSTLKVAKVDRTQTVELEPPTLIRSADENQCSTPLGRIAFRRDRRLVHLPVESLRRHVYITGKTGVGKSTLMHSMLTANMRSNFGVALLDPHGDLYADAIALVPRRRNNSLVLFDPSADNLVPFNPIDVRSGMNRERLAEGVLAAFVKIFKLEAAVTPRLLHILRNALYVLVEQPEATLIGINRLLNDAAYRKSAVARVSNPAVREFWHAEFGRWHERDRVMFIASLQNKLGGFLTNTHLQLILGQPRSGFHLRTVIDERQILLCNLSKGKIGEDAAGLLGALLLSSLQLAGESRADIELRHRPDFVCYVDEVQNYATSALATGLSEARKYRAPLFVLANQYRDQLTPDLQTAIVGNCGSVIAFQVGSEDAEYWSRHFRNKVSPEHLTALPKYHAIADVLLDGMPSGPMTIRTLKPSLGRASQADRLIRHSQRRFAKPAEKLRESVRLAYG